jgi:hypothetical protein
MNMVTEFCFVEISMLKLSLGIELDLIARAYAREDRLALMTEGLLEWLCDLKTETLPLTLLWSRIKMYLRQNGVSSVNMVVTTYLVTFYYLNVIKLKESKTAQSFYVS